MKIGVMSDTHLRSPDEVLEYILDELLNDTDMILHAGDIVGKPVLDYLEARGVLAVCGNMDDYEIAGSAPSVRIVSAEGKRIGLIHGWGSKTGLEPRIVRRFEDPKPDVIVYGHSHEPFWDEVEGVWMFNPGSANPYTGARTPTVGALLIRDDTIEGEFLTVER